MSPQSLDKVTLNQTRIAWPQWPSETLAQATVATSSLYLLCLLSYVQCFQVLIPENVVQHIVSMCWPQKMLPKFIVLFLVGSGGRASSSSCTLLNSILSDAFAASQEENVDGILPLRLPFYYPSTKHARLYVSLQWDPISWATATSFSVSALSETLNTLPQPQNCTFFFCLLHSWLPSL